MTKDLNIDWLPNAHFPGASDIVYIHVLIKETEVITAKIIWLKKISIFSKPFTDKNYELYSESNKIVYV